MKTYKEVFDLLDLTATATHKGNNILITGNKELEELRASHVKSIEDILFNELAKDDIIYVRKYEHMYKHII